jgi:hypothetical protein
VEAVLALARSPAARQEAGATLRRRIASDHLGDGWRRHLREVMDALPDTHQVYPGGEPRAVAPAQRDFFLAILWRGGKPHSMDEHVWTVALHALEAATRALPTIDRECLRELAECYGGRATRGGALTRPTGWETAQAHRLNRQLAREILARRAQAAYQTDRYAEAQRLARQSLTSDWHGWRDPKLAGLLLRSCYRNLRRHLTGLAQAVVGRRSHSQAG